MTEKGDRDRTRSSSSEDIPGNDEKRSDRGAEGAAPVLVIPAPDAADAMLGDVIDRLPSQFREEILRQYDLPQESYSLFEIFKWATPVEVVMQIFGLLMAIGAGAALPLLTIVMGQMTNTFGGFVSPDTPSIAGIHSAYDFTSKVKSLALDLVYIGLSVLIAVFLANVCWIVSGERISRRIREHYLQAVLRQNIAFFDRLGAGEVTNRISHDVDLIQDGISDKVSITAQAIATFFSGFIIAFTRSWKFTLVLSCILPTMLIIFGVGGKSVAKLAQKIVGEYSSAATVAEEVLSSVRTAQAFGTETRLAEEYDGNLVSAQQVGYRKAAVMSFMFAAIFTLVYLAYGLAFWEGSRLIADGELNVGLVMNCLFAVIFASFSLSQIAPRIENFAKAVAAAQKIFQTIYRVPSIDSLSDAGERPKDIQGDIEFKNVSFIYPSRPEGNLDPSSFPSPVLAVAVLTSWAVTVLKNISLSIPAGKFTAIVGASGSGKSTIIALLERFYDPVQGSITLDNYPLPSLNLRFLRAQISLVQQEPVLFACSIYENICHGMIETELEHASEEVKREAVVKACVMANADGFIKGLPDGYDTVVGERGFLLSGGQKQRIAIARAVVSDPKILLLDEATSALDTASERVVQHALDEASKSRTTVCIAHRLSTIKNADKIIVMSRGEIVEEGTHAELIALGGVYQGLVTAQRISSERKDGIAVALEADDVQEDAFDGLVRAKSMDSSSAAGEMGLVKTKTARSVGSIEAERPGFESAGMMPQTMYSNIQLIRKGLRWNKGEYLWLTVGWLTTLLTGGVYPAQAVLFAYLITDLLNPNIPAMRSRANFLSLWWLIIAIVEFCAYSLQTWGFGYASEKMVRRVRFESFRAILRQEIAFFDRSEHSTGSLTTMLSTEATSMAGLSGVNLGAILTVLVNLTSGIIVSISFGWKLGLVAFSLIPFTLMAGYFRFALLNKLSDQLRAAYESSAQLACEQVAAIRTVASLNREVSLHAEFVENLKAPIRKALYSTFKSTLMFALGQSLGFFTNALVFWFGSRLVASREYNMTQFFVCFMALTIGSQAAGQFFSFAPDISKARSSSINVNRLIERTPLIDSWSDKGKHIDKLEQGHLQFNDVHFRYPTRPHVPVLRGLTFEVKPGQYVALVGASGCGKSTTVGLIERFYDPLVGDIVVDGLSVAGYNLAEYRKNISLVSQEPTLYQGTIRFNILLGALRNVSEEEIDQACRDANIYDFIQTLPQGYETMVGTRGSALSGGQKQRIAIARALIRNPKILLLDEATSALDSESEKVVQEALDKAARGRTTLAIAHRLSTIQKADMIYVIDRGRVVERGRHDELVALGGRYFELARQQELQKREMEGM